MKIQIIISKVIEEKFGLKLKKRLQEEKLPFIEIDKLPHFLTEQDSSSINADALVAICVHSLTDMPKRFCVHPAGNPGDLWPHKSLKNLGGEKKMISKTSGVLLTELYRSLLKNNFLKDFIVSVESTHHGPNITKPIVFLEIGSSQEVWCDINAQEVLIKVLKDIVLEKNGFDAPIRKSWIVIGGNHYMTNIKHLLLRDDFFVSHMIAGNQVSNLNEDLLNQLFDKTLEPIEGIILDVADVGQHGPRIIELLESNKLAYRFLHEFV